MRLSIRERSTVLAALRFYQSNLDDEPADIHAIYTIATDDGDIDPLSADEIDTLCEKLNTDGEG